MTYLEILGYTCATAGTIFVLAVAIGFAKFTWDIFFGKDS